MLLLKDILRVSCEMLLNDAVAAGSQVDLRGCERVGTGGAGQPWVFLGVGFLFWTIKP